jgi:pyruvate carboxylase
MTGKLDRVRRPAAVYAGAMDVAVPFAGVVSPLVAEGDRVESGQAVATIEAMKMEASITAPMAGTVARLMITETGQASGGDLLLVLE